MNREEILNRVFEAIEVYNRYRSPEASAKLVELSGNRLVVEFSGSFCLTCGVRDWVEDFKYMLEDFGVENDLVEYVESGERTRLGVFIIRSSGEGNDR